MKLDDYQIVLKMMNQRKSWTQQEDQLLSELYRLHSFKLKTHASNWNTLSKLLNQQKMGPERTGKQCRQRWCNQLNPQIKKDQIWSDKEEEILFKSHQKYGNRWSLISKELPGRTDNSIKNYFNSTLRKSLRFINLYIASNRKYKQFKYRNVKEYKPQLLSKILALSSSSLLDAELLSQCYKFSTKYSKQERLKQKTAENLAKQIKRKLLSITLLEKNQPFQVPTDLCYYISNIQYEDIIMKIHQLNSQCKKRKTKKRESLNYNIEDQMSQNDLQQRKEYTRGFSKKYQRKAQKQFAANGLKPIKDMNGGVQIDGIDCMHIEDQSQKQKNKCMLEEDKDFFNCLNNSQPSQQYYEESFCLCGQQMYEQDDWLLSSHYV